MLNLKNPPKKYRNIPFWSLNDRLEEKELKRQINLMNSSGMGGFFMHARGGLETKYLSKEWFNRIEACVNQGEKTGLKAWAYDENGWPSGFGDMAVPSISVDFQQKYLVFEEGVFENTDTTLYNKNGYHIYYKINPFYVDNLNEKVVKKFIEVAYEPYFKKFKNRIEGFFTDEPQLKVGAIPWSFVLPEKFKEEYNLDLLENLVYLFVDSEKSADIRVKFWELVTRLFSESYAKQIYTWCEKRGLKFTGHMVSENKLVSQLPSNGAVMPNYEFFHIPGIDWLGRKISDPLVPLQVSSVAAQMGKKQILSESFALCGHNVSFSELRRIFEWQAVHGVNLLCTHLAPYSLRGIRKRDYPPALFFQQPYFEHYEKFISSMARIGMLLAEGKIENDTLLIHPQTSAWAVYNNKKPNEILDDVSNSFINDMETLDKKHILYHLGDETIIKKYGKIEGKYFVIGKQKYSTVVLPKHICFLDSTKKLLEEFKSNGGKITVSDEIAKNNVIDNENVTYAKRIFDKFTMHYFVNSTEEKQACKTDIGNKELDILTGEEIPLNREFTLNPFESKVVFDYGEKYKKPEKREPAKIDVSGLWKIKDSSLNTMTLDKCDLFIDDKLIEKEIPTTSIQQIACSFEKKVKAECVYKVNIEALPAEICLISETPEKFNFYVNGKKLSFENSGDFIDGSFKKSQNIAEYLRHGENIIAVTCDFVQSKKVYNDLRQIRECEVIKNKFTYDFEIENIYLAGKFGVFPKVVKGNKQNDFYISKLPEAVELSNIEQQGFSFFAGKLTLEKEIEVPKKDLLLYLNLKGINTVCAKINGKEKTGIYTPFAFEVENGKDTVAVQLEITNNLHNLLGPHHLAEGESLYVIPGNFFKGESFWNWSKAVPWDEDYTIAETSLK